MFFQIIKLALFYQFKIMKTVNHNQFGRGIIISEDENNVIVDFNGLVKKFIIKFAKLTNEDGSPFGVAFVPKIKKEKKLNKANFMSHEEYMKSDIAKMSKDEFEAHREGKKRQSHSTFF